MKFGLFSGQLHACLVAATSLAMKSSPLVTKVGNEVYVDG